MPLFIRKQARSLNRSHKKTAPKGGFILEDMQRQRATVFE